MLQLLLTNDVLGEKKKNMKQKILPKIFELNYSLSGLY